jgi:hypothetical protein
MMLLQLLLPPLLQEVPGNTGCFLAASALLLSYSSFARRRRSALPRLHVPNPAPRISDAQLRELVAGLGTLRPAAPGR